MLGPLLPALIQRWHIQDAQAGTLFTVSFTGQFCGAWFATRNLRASILYGSAITAAGCAAMAWVDFSLAHIALFCVGFGLGLGLTAGNVIAGTAVPAARARLIALLNVAWGLGAIACPVLVRMSSSRGVQYFFLAAAAFLAVTSLASLAIPKPTQSADPAERPRTPHHLRNPRSRACLCLRYLSLSSASPPFSMSASRTRLEAGCPATPFALIGPFTPLPSPSTSGWPNSPAEFSSLC